MRLNVEDLYDEAYNNDDVWDSFVEDYINKYPEDVYDIIFNHLEATISEDEMSFEEFEKYVDTFIINNPNKVKEIVSDYLIKDVNDTFNLNADRWGDFVTNWVEGEIGDIYDRAYDEWRDDQLLKEIG